MWNLFLILMVLLCQPFPAFGVNIGLDTTVTRFDVQQRVENGDRIAGFASLDAGFFLASAFATATFDSFLPVSGTIDLNFATLNLNQDLIIHNRALIHHLGNINGNGHIFELPPSAYCLPTEEAADLCTITFTCDNAYAMPVNSASFSYDNRFIAVGTDLNASGDEFFVDEAINENYLVARSSAGFTQNIYAVAWHPSNDWIAIARAGGAGDELYTYTFDRGGYTLSLLDSVDLGGTSSSANAVAWHPDGDHLAVASDADSQELIVYEMDSAGSFGSSVTLNLSQDANTISWNADGSCLAVGTNGAEGWDELRTYTFTKSPLGLGINASFDTGSAINSVSWNTNASANGELVVGLNGGSRRLRLFRHNSGGGTITELSTAGDSTGAIVNGVAWHSGGKCIAAGLNDNTDGTGGELRTYHFDNDALTQADDHEEGDNVEALAWSPNGRLIIAGDDGIGSASPRVALYRFDKEFLVTSVVTFDALNVVFNGNGTFADTSIKFTGESSISGLGNVISFAPTCTLVVDSNSSLLIKDITIKGVDSDTIRLMDNTSTVSFQDVALVLDGDYALEKGHFEILKELKISGDGHSFIYQTPEPSTIRSRDPQAITASGECRPGFGGTWIFEQGVTFSYDPSVSNTLIVFEGNTSELILNSATLHTTVTGLQLTKGKLTVKGEAFVASEDQETDGGIMVGDGVAANDFIVYVEPGAVLSHSSGYLVYNNANPDKFKSLSQIARIIRNPNSKIYVQNDLNLHDITIELVSNSVDPIEIASGKQLSYSNTLIKLPGIETEVTADQQQTNIYLLNGSSSLFLTKGILPINLSISGSSNELLGNGSVSGTVTLADDNASMLSSLNGFIRNAITLNNGTFTLAHELSLPGDGKIVGPGRVNIASTDLSYSKAQDANTSIIWQGNGGNIFFGDNVSLSSTWTLNGQVTLDCKGNEFVLNEDAALVVDQGSVLTLKNIRLSGLQNNNIRCLDDDGIIHFINTDVILDNDYTFTKGSMSFALDNSFSGTHIFTYDSVQTATINMLSKLKFKDGTTFSTDRSDAAASVEPLEFEDRTSILHLDDSTWSIGDQGIQVTKGTIRISRGSTLEINSTSTVNGFILGNGQSAGDAFIQLDPSSILNLSMGHFIYNITDASGFISKSRTSRIIQGDAFSAHFMKNIEFSNATIQLSLASFTTDPGISVIVNNISLDTPVGDYRITGNRPSAYTVALSGGGDAFYIDSGVAPFPIFVSNTNNTIGGEGDIAAAIVLQDSDTELTSQLIGRLTSSMVMNGGTLILDNDLHLANGVMFVGDDNVNLNSAGLHLGSQNLTWSGNTYWSGTGGAIHFNSNVSLVGTWTFSGNCVLHGNGHVIDLGSTGRIFVDTSGIVMLHALKLKNVNDGNISCVDDTASVVLDDLAWYQPENSYYSFDTGSLEFKHKVLMSGNGVFAYHTSQTSTIVSESKLVLDEGFTFSYDPIIASKSLLEFEDDTAGLVLKSASLHSTATGMQLMKGVLTVKGDSYLSSERVIAQAHVPYILNEGITFGSGAAADDFSCVIVGGASLGLTEGTLVYNNSDPDLLIIENKASQLEIGAQARLTLEESLRLVTGGIEFGNHATLMIKNGRTLTSSIFPLGYLHRRSKS